MKKTKHPQKTIDLNRPLENSKVLAEKVNGRLACIGVFALVGTYLSTGQIIPGFL